MTEAEYLFVKRTTLMSGNFCFQKGEGGGGKFSGANEKKTSLKIYFI